MDLTHLHLLITHLPIFGTILGAIVLAYGLSVNSNHTKMAAYILFVISSIGAVISYVSGEAAEETVEKIKGLSESNIEQHEEFALFALIALIILGIISLIGIYLTRKNSRLTRTIALITFFISIICFGMIAWTGYLGGQVRHTEINSASLTGND